MQWSKWGEVLLIKIYDPIMRILRAFMKPDLINNKNDLINFS